MCTCPRCGAINTENWPLDIAGKIVMGGCQDCWERECDRSLAKYLQAYYA